MDATAITSGFQLIIGLVTGLADTIGKVKDLSLRAELQGTIVALQGQIMQVQQENIALVDENRCLKDEASERADVAEYKFEKNAYWKDGRAYCLHCMEEHRKARTLIRWGEHSSVGTCVTCEKKLGGIFEFTPAPTMSERRDAVRQRNSIRTQY
ncbi:MAG: hypothetical protein ACKVS9_08150 [Phycisphaerae bacterium]